MGLIRPWMVVLAGAVIWFIGQSWDLAWHEANPGVPGYDPAHALFYLGIAVAVAGAGWWIVARVRRAGA
jgi:hypothetical protein